MEPRFAANEDVCEGVKKTKLGRKLINLNHHQQQGAAGRDSGAAEIEGKEWKRSEGKKHKVIILSFGISTVR